MTHTPRVQRLIEALRAGEQVHIQEAPLPVLIKLHVQQGLLQGRAVVYRVDGYLPPSVRELESQYACLSLEGTVLYFDHLLDVDAHSESELSHAVDDFLAQAMDWQDKVDEFDQRDRIKVRVR
jgi:hypothetical protein